MPPKMVVGGGKESGQSETCGLLFFIIVFFLSYIVPVLADKSFLLGTGNGIVR